jgi:hypothetical protein
VSYRLSAVGGWRPTNRDRSNAEKGDCRRVPDLALSPVYGCSRRGCDLTDYDSLPAAINVPLADVAALDLVILNGGILGEIKNLTDTPVEDL